MESRTARSLADDPCGKDPLNARLNARSAASNSAAPQLQGHFGSRSLHTPVIYLGQDRFNPRRETIYRAEKLTASLWLRFTRGFNGTGWRVSNPALVGTHDEASAQATRLRFMDLLACEPLELYAESAFA